MNNSWQKDYPLQDLTEEGLDENHSLRKMLRLVGENKRVIDFGCATGYFSQLLTKKGCRVTGVEFNPDAAKFAEQYCEQVIVADLDLVSLAEILPSHTFDVAIFGDILEHLRDPWKILKETQQLLKSEGYVVASLPNIAHGAIRLALLQGRFEYTALGILDNTHLRFFTRKTVEDLFERSGYFLDIIDRTKLSIFSEAPLIPHIDKNVFDKKVIEQIEQDEEAETFQFVLRSFPKTQEGNYAALNERYSNLIQVERSQLQLQQTQTELERSLRQASLTQSQLQQTQTELERSQLQLQRTQVELERSQATITSMQTSKFWKLRTKWFKLKQRTKLFNLIEKMSKPVKQLRINLFCFEKEQYDR
ncbi:class I SAM-dependent methyltransferase [Chroococcidiopsis sp. CCMEE 29]|uniref:class I SAM-dependent methyltransferase n=1 Tax=Chroococcidiopsis sp. CCMEE 29 TaxID=155894 RepID=UPI002022427F|nr:class I SAM-dependent methyltransferase [Chroococcidiopsis sp. CCMEE 29]